MDVTLRSQGDKPFVHVTAIAVDDDVFKFSIASIAHYLSLSRSLLPSHFHSISRLS
jgi:hypothetical protein